VARDGTQLDETSCRYDQAFALLALAHADAAGLDDASLETRALSIRRKVSESALPQGGFLEADAHPYQSNCHMHLLEACMAWEGQGDADWAPLSDRIVDLAERRFIDPVTGRLREFFDADWRPAAGDDGRLVEPGHQFEWAWLLARHGVARGRPELVERARTLYAHGREGVCERGGVAQDALNDDGSLRSDQARLWPQTEWLKAALLLAGQSRGAERDALIAEFAAANR
jgi:mannose/cellobiose epimerase-like protein (N-acyl-D-glucosamine 2-epimerase family)